HSARVHWRWVEYAALLRPTELILYARQKILSPPFRGERGGPTARGWGGGGGVGRRSGIPHLSPTFSAPPRTKAGGEGVAPRRSCSPALLPSAAAGIRAPRNQGR